MSSGRPSNVRHACKQQRKCFNENIETIPAGLEEFSTMLGVSRSQGLGISHNLSRVAFILRNGILTWLKTNVAFAVLR